MAPVATEKKRTMRKTLNLGAGNRFAPADAGCVNHDLTRHGDHIDVIHDLNDMPWPWEDESFDRIVAWAVLEHIPANLIMSFNECWRILKSGGQLEVKLPLWDAEESYSDPTHYWQFSLRSLDQFVPTTERGAAYDFYTPFKWVFEKEPWRCSPNSLGAILLKGEVSV